MPFDISDLREIVWLTISVSGVAVFLSSLLGVPCGFWLAVTEFRGKRLVSAIVQTGMALPPVVVGLALYLLLSHSGPLAAWDLLFTPQAMIIAQTILALPFVIGITWSAVSAVPSELALQVRSLGASDWQCHWAILREARAGVLLSIAAALGRSLSEVGAVLIVGGNIREHTRVLTTAIVLETSKGNFPFALALGGTLLAMAMTVNLLIVGLQGGRRGEH